MAITFANRIYHYASVVALCAIVIGGVAFVFMTIQRMPAARAAFEQKLNAEAAEKSRVACEKWGMPLAQECIWAARGRYSTSSVG